MSDPEDKTDVGDGMDAEPELVKDLDVDENISEAVRGGQSYGGTQPAPTKQA